MEDKDGWKKRDNMRKKKQRNTLIKLLNSMTCFYWRYELKHAYKTDDLNP